MISLEIFSFGIGQLGPGAIKLETDWNLPGCQAAPGG